MLFALILIRLSVNLLFSFSRRLGSKLEIRFGLWMLDSTRGLGKILASCFTEHVQHQLLLSQLFCVYNCCGLTYV
jgi:hypothetical protein